jgi:peptidoglycan/LPS O-acetylase OafA/YrhL
MRFDYHVPLRVWNKPGVSLTVASSRAAVLENRSTAPDARPQESIAPPGAAHIPSLDGIRAISFFLVFFSHAGLGGVVPGGFGVNIFFLLSGFLITTLLRMEFARSGHIDLGAFYVRRVLRILPPLYVTLALALVLCVIQSGPGSIPVPGTVAQALQVFNFYQIYADPPTFLPGTGVLWSLAVEEHFYLVFPLLYAWMCPRLSVRGQSALLLTMCAAALAWRCVLHYFHFRNSFDHTYMGTDARFDSILFGCVFAIAANPVLNDPLYRKSLREMRWLLPVSTVVLLTTFVIRNDSFRETLRYTVQGLALIPLFMAAIYYQKSWPVRFLNLPLVRFLGVLSYSLYLGHSIIMTSIERVWPTSIGSNMATLAGALCFATLVHYAVELPATRLRKRFMRAPAGSAR